MFREIEVRPREREQAEPDRGGRGGMTPLGIDGPEAARDALTHDLDLPRGRSRERVQAHGREYRLSGSEVRTLAAAGAFRVVPAGELTPSDTRTPTRPSREIAAAAIAALRLRPDLRAGDGQLAIDPVAVHRVQPGLCQQAAHIAFPCAGRPGYADKKRLCQV